jgi:hypothetical protein
VLAAAAMLTRLAVDRGVSVALVIAAAITLLEIQPILAARPRPYFAGSSAAVRAVADALPPDALVAIDSSFADLQIQVPLWLVHERETLMLRGGSRRWERVMDALVASGRPVYWINNLYEPVPEAPGLTFHAAAADATFSVPLPDAPADSPPARVVTRIVPLKIYAVTPADTVTGSAGTNTTSGPASASVSR